MRVREMRRDNRYATRLDVRVTAVLREYGSSQRFEVDLHDLSLTGFRCRTSFRLNAGQSVSVTIPGLAPLESRVAWVDGFDYGCAFERALHVSVFDHLVRRHRKSH
jgi:PilZ domain